MYKGTERIGQGKDCQLKLPYHKKSQLGHTKANYLIENGLAKIYKKETVDKLKSCDAFGVAFDENEVNLYSVNNA